MEQLSYVEVDALPAHTAPAREDVMPSDDDYQNDDDWTLTDRDEIVLDPDPLPPEIHPVHPPTLDTTFIIEDPEERGHPEIPGNPPEGSAQEVLPDMIAYLAGYKPTPYQSYWAMQFEKISRPEQLDITVDRFIETLAAPPRRRGRRPKRGRNGRARLPTSF